MSYWRALLTLLGAEFQSPKSSAQTESSAGRPHARLCPEFLVLFYFIPQSPTVAKCGSRDTHRERERERERERGAYLERCDAVEVAQSYTAASTCRHSSPTRASHCTPPPHRGHVTTRWRPVNTPRPWTTDEPSPFLYTRVTVVIIVSSHWH